MWTRGLTMWYVDYLLINQEEIRTRADFDSDEFLDLLAVEKEIKRLRETNLLPKKYFDALDSYLNPYQKQTNKTYQTINKLFRAVSDIVGNKLGGKFTDQGYLEYMRDVYHLTEEQVLNLKAFMRSNLSNKILTRPFIRKTNVKKINR
jgi:hypothetical protein